MRDSLRPQRLRCSSSCRARSTRARICVLAPSNVRSPRVARRARRAATRIRPSALRAARLEKRGRGPSQHDGRPDQERGPREHTEDRGRRARRRMRFELDAAGQRRRELGLRAQAGVGEIGEPGHEARHPAHGPAGLRVLPARGEVVRMVRRVEAHDAQTSGSEVEEVRGVERRTVHRRRHQAGEAHGRPRLHRERRDAVERQLHREWRGGVHQRYPYPEPLSITTSGSSAI